ncbi:hypothetical protein HBH56_196990 [Parastagonospora nodorum]|uniref:Uncharacterized protein n=1 Tax=Phaeosphaeria nodorum (strain SN15 / ATCC MYA-4574 / FGSC 10173) TaxID=321614 RepID=A0A7U2I0T3_PHANO|nr:hypothetical protein HBH56_196990 [Parastagonospora nodorum]QRC97574.1 hypothetical protein JI435_086530 [Parastagonospora nodorum SN15]KAH3924698.1 hypothetical protein HBH54_189950 [Parastagonospora nodorum]KAH3966107.1 hypothetical protein HBH52_200430 [Parastagonospora nodorum]KAH3973434.1 hypothetical protein HBH51_099020 [Parastagonospora nodorum]
MSRNLQERGNGTAPSKRPRPDSASAQGGAVQVTKSAKNSNTPLVSALYERAKDQVVLAYLEERLLDVQNAHAALQEANKNAAVIKLERDTMKTELDEFTEWVANLCEELHRAQNKNSVTTREMQNLRHTFQPEHQIARESSDKANPVVIEMEGLKSQIDDLASENTDMGAENVSLREQGITTTAEKEKQATENLGLTEHIADIAAEKDSQAIEFQKQLDIMKSENESFSVDRENLVGENGSLAAEKDALTTDKTKLEAEVIELQKAYNTSTRTRSG